MRKQIAAANWKMNLTLEQGTELLNQILSERVELQQDQQVVIAVPFPYLSMAQHVLSGTENYFIAAQNCSNKTSGAYTGEVSAPMLQSMGIKYCLVGHSERREYFLENGKLLAEKVNACLGHGIIPVFCCGEPLNIRESGDQNNLVKTQLEESLFHLSATEIKQVVIAYEPVWAIGTGKTASTEQAQEMHAFIRSALTGKYGAETSKELSILYGGSVKGANAKEIFASPDVDGGLVGGASLVAAEFVQIIKALKNKDRTNI